LKDPFLQPSNFLGLEHKKASEVIKLVKLLKEREKERSKEREKERKLTMCIK
jgi:low affinity Fe/Cu permease